MLRKFLFCEILEPQEASLSIREPVDASENQITFTQNSVASIQPSVHIKCFRFTPDQDLETIPSPRKNWTTARETSWDGSSPES